MQRDSNSKHLEPLNSETLHRWLNDYATRTVLEGLRLAKEDIVQLVLLDSDNIQDRYLYRRINQYIGALRTLQQILDSKELESLLEEHKLFVRST